MDPLDAVARAVLYEGYLLWPYRRSSLKNRRRWTLGGVYPQGWSREHPDDAARARACCLVEADGEPEATVTVRFLHEGKGEEGAIERELTVGPLRLEGLEALAPQRSAITVPDTASAETTWLALAGELVVGVEAVDGGLFRLWAEVENRTPWDQGSRDEAVRRAFLSLHIVLRASGGSFVSLTDPPERHRVAAAACRNDGLWPVLAGVDGDRSAMLAAPIILPDHPRVAPESAGDFFDATEIEQLLDLGLMALTEDERAEIRGGDSRARQVLERAGSASAARRRLRGAFRDVRGGFWTDMAQPAPHSIAVDGALLRRGSRVRLRPRSRGAAPGALEDLSLDGRSAVVESLEEDEAGRLHVAVTLEDDPKRALGDARQPGHRFFFRPEEVEPLGEPSARILVAGIGNIFLGDDGLGVEAARVLAARPLPAGVSVVDFGIRGMDLAYALQEEWDLVILVDATQRGGEPGTVYLIEAEAADSSEGVDAHGMHPARVLALARTLGAVLPRVVVVGCEPAVLPDPEDPESLLMELSERVRQAVPEVVAVVESVIASVAMSHEEVG
jgi:hydrogenase maturation protease